MKIKAKSPHSSAVRALLFQKKFLCLFYGNIFFVTLAKNAKS